MIKLFAKSLYRIFFLFLALGSGYGKSTIDIDAWKFLVQFGPCYVFSIFSLQTSIPTMVRSNDETTEGIKADVQSGMYIFCVTNISKGKAFLLEGLTYKRLGHGKTFQFIKWKDMIS